MVSLIESGKWYDQLIFQRRRHYWRLDGKSLQLFMSEEEQRISKEIPLASVLDCRLAEIIGVMHLELQLSGEIVYYIADDTSGITKVYLFSYIIFSKANCVTSPMVRPYQESAATDGPSP